MSDPIIITFENHFYSFKANCKKILMNKLIFFFKIQFFISSYVLLKYLNVVVFSIFLT